MFLNRSCRPRFSPLTLAVGLAALILPTPLLLIAQEKAPEPTPAAPPATTAASQPAKTREQKKAEDTARVMDFFRVAQPDMYEQAKSIRDNDPASFDKMIHSSLNMVNKLEDLRKRNPPLFELRMKDFELAYKTLKVAKDCKRPDLAPADKESLMKQLTDLVSTQFDLRQKIRQLEIDDVQKQLATLGQQLEDRKADKDTIIKKRVDDLIESVPRLEW
jgi:hypothetical protein